MAKILVENGERAYLGKLFGVSQPTIRRALDGKTNTDLAKKIRKVAIDRGGVVWKIQCKLPPKTKAILPP